MAKYETLDDILNVKNVNEFTKEELEYFVTSFSKTSFLYTNGSYVPDEIQYNDLILKDDIEHNIKMFSLVHGEDKLSPAVRLTSF